MMKKVLCLMMAWCLLAVPTALAAEDLTGRPLADGVVSAVHYLDVTAPMSGTLNAFDLTAGDTVAAGQNLMGFITTGVYATENATVGAVFVQPGDDAAAAMARSLMRSISSLLSDRMSIAINASSGMLL